MSIVQGAVLRKPLDIRYNYATMNFGRIAILGAGSWGTALAHLLSGKDVPVTLWDRDDILTAQIRELRHNPKYLPDTPLSETVDATSLMKDAVTGASWVIVAVASDGVRSVVAEAAPFIEPGAIVISACKGLDAETGLTTSEIIKTLLDDVAHAGLVVMSGPNLATELAHGIPSATVVAGIDPQITRAAQALLMTDHSFRVYTQADVKGVELGGALKNVLAIGSGLSDGLGFGDNTKAALMTRGLMEITQLGVASGGKALTFMGLAGVGDLMATMASKLSRNYRVGLGLAGRKPLDTVLREVGQAAEGVPTAQAAQVLSRRYKVQTPVLTAIYEVLYEGKSPVVAVDELMTRGAREEFE
jgi:glycerol-3-phosphate dehydrogenase (NAD(P)+)